MNKALLAAMILMLTLLAGCGNTDTATPPEKIATIKPEKLGTFEITVEEFRTRFNQLATLEPPDGAEEVPHLQPAKIFYWSNEIEYPTNYTGVKVTAIKSGDNIQLVQVANDIKSSEAGSKFYTVVVRVL